jgi:hypothetical protein
MTHRLQSRARLAVFALAAVGVAGCAPPSQQDIQTAQALSELGVSFNDLRQTQQELQDQVDSLKTIVVRQDSVIRTLANLAGVKAPP